MSIKKLVLFMTILVTTIALATTFGPFSISVAGPQYVTTGFDTDQAAEFEGASKVAGIMLAGLLNTPAKIVKAVKGDSIRIVYSDGQIADFRIARWPSTDPLVFTQKLSSGNIPIRTASSDPTGECVPGTGQNAGVEIGYATGYYGQSGSQAPDGTVTITGYWVDTGTVYVYSPLSKYTRYCP